MKTGTNKNIVFGLLIVCAVASVCFLGLYFRKDTGNDSQVSARIAEKKSNKTESQTPNPYTQHETDISKETGFFHKAITFHDFLTDESGNIITSEGGEPLITESKETNLYGNVIDPRKTRIKITSPDTMTIETPGEQYTGLSLKEYFQLGHYKAVYSGGYLSSWSPPLPLGYVKIEGETLNRAHNTYVTDGLFCVRDGEVLITSFNNPDQFKNWDNCLQAGTPLIQDGKVVIDQSREGWYITGQPNVQAFICQFDDGKVLIGMSEEEVSLTDLTEYLAKPENEGGLGCVNAIGRAGGRTAGMIVDQNGKSHGFGNTDIPLPNALVIE